MISIDQIRAARALKNWSQSDLAEHTGISVPSIANIELGKQQPSSATLEKILSALSLAGIAFTDDDGVKKNLGEVTTLTGKEGFSDFMDDVYETARTVGGEIRLFNNIPDYWIKWLGEDWYDMHSQRMAAIKDNFDFKITVRKGDWNFIAQDFAEYRWFSTNVFDSDACLYAYGDKLAFLDFVDDDNIHILVLHQKEFADAFKAIFNIAWKNLTIIPHK